jgi:CSLREA domain-containing protein
MSLLFLAAGLTLILPPATSYAIPLTFVVNSEADQVDMTPGDGICVATPSGLCTLRAAVMEANAHAGADTITLPSGRYTLSLTGTDDVAGVGDLDITEDLTIVGTESAGTIVDGDQIDRIFDVIGFVKVSMSKLTVTKGLASDPGGGIRIPVGAVANLDDTRFVSNDRAIYNLGDLTIIPISRGSAVFGETATPSGEPQLRHGQPRLVLHPRSWRITRT